METIYGANRCVLYLEDPVEALNTLDTSRERGITSAIEQFLDSPRGAFSKSIDTHLWQVRDLNTNTRAFTTWCQNEALNVELCVVHLIYEKQNERDAFAQCAAFDAAGAEFQKAFADRTEAEYAEWKSRIKDQAAYRVQFS